MSGFDAAFDLTAEPYRLAYVHAQAFVTRPLCIVQARLHSSRLPNKMLLTLGGETLIARGVRIATEAFGCEHVVVAIPKSDHDGPLGDELRRIGCKLFAWDGDESDVLGRFYACALMFRWHPQAVIVRYTPDDPHKDPDALRRVASGERLPVELGGEAFTLAQLTRAQQLTAPQDPTREHIGNNALLCPADPPPMGLGVWTIDTREQYDAVCGNFAPFQHA